MQLTALVEARRRAEEAVQDMADGPLKVTAFGVILRQLLNVDSIGADVASNGTALATTRSAREAAGSTGTVVDEDPKSARARILALREEGFFDAERSLPQICAELKNHGWIYPQTSVSGPLQVLVQRRELRRTIGSDGNRKIYLYVRP